MVHGLWEYINQRMGTAYEESVIVRKGEDGLVVGGSTGGDERILTTRSY